MSTFTVAANEPLSSSPSRLTVLKPVRAKLTVYVPGSSSVMRYCPVPSVTALRTFSMSAGLDASTTTPGRTAPEASFTTPEIEAPLCAAAVHALSRTRTLAATTLIHPRMIPPWRVHPTRWPQQTSPYRSGITVAPKPDRVQYIFRRLRIQDWYRLPVHGF